MSEEQETAIDVAYDDGLSDMQRLFVHFLRETGNPTRAAELAEYAQPSASGSQLMKNPKIRAVLSASVQERLASGAVAALDYLVKTITDTTAPRAQRNDAAKTVLNRAGIVEKRAKIQEDSDDKPLSEMGVDELERVIGKLSDSLEKARDASALTPDNAQDNAQAPGDTE